MPRGRRGIIAGAAAIVIGALATGPAKPVKAGDGNSLTLGVNFLNTSTTETELIMTTATNVNAAFSVHVQGGGTSAGMIALGGGAGSGIRAFGGPNGGTGVVGGGGGNADGVQGTGHGNFTGVVGFGGENGGSGILGIGGPKGGGAHIGAGVIGTTNGFNPPPIDTVGGTMGFSNVSGVPGVFGKATVGDTPGVIGSGSFAAAGVFGINSFVNGIGVQGFNEFGSAVQGNTDIGTGVLGKAKGTGIGVRGESDTGNGVFAQSRTNVGVYAASGSSYAVLGASSGAHGVTGTTSAAGYAGLVGQAGANNTTGLVGTVAPGTTGTYAAQFAGPVLVDGQQVVTGSKSAAVPHPDGTHRLLYCVESPEAWFEDFGEGTITGGKAEVKLDPDFAAVVETAKLHVFFTPHDDQHTLHLTGRSATAFTVAAATTAEAAARGRKAGDMSGTFSYRVVAKRKDVKAERLAKYALPKFAPLPTLTHPPLPPTPPMLPTPPKS